MNTPVVPQIEQEVLRRYQQAAESKEVQLCCPIEYDCDDISFLPQEIVEKDYGCGNPSKYVREGETVLDLGSGAGKICYILSKRVGPKGRVIGVDFNDTMLALARKYQDEIAQKLGYGNVRFLKGKIQDLALDINALQEWMDRNPVRTVEDVMHLEAERERLRVESPLIPDDSIDVIVSNCVLNLVQQSDKAWLFDEMFRVLKPGGRAVISDIVCDEDVTQSILSDPELWSGCISGAFREDLFLEKFEESGFYGIEILSRQETPWQVIEGIEFRSITVQAFKGVQAPCLERNQAVIYQGPWRTVQDDEGHSYIRGQRTAVCDKIYNRLTDPAGPYQGEMIPVPPYEDVPPSEAQLYDCKRRKVRHPNETKGKKYQELPQAQGESCCGPGCC